MVIRGVSVDREMDGGSDGLDWIGRITYMHRINIPEQRRLSVCLLAR